MSITRYANFPIYGAHFAEGAETTIKNRKKMYTVELFYVQTYNGAHDIARMRRLSRLGYCVILRIDYRHGQTVPAAFDWEGRRSYASACARIAADLEGIVDLFIIGNEMDSPHEGAIPSHWYTKVFAGYDEDNVYDRIKAVRPDAVVLAGALSAWPGFRHEPDSRTIWFDAFIRHVPKVDGFALHAYSGWSYWDGSGDIEDPRFSDMTGFLSFRTYMSQIYERFNDTLPVFITETNTYWNLNPHAPTGYADQNYRTGWIHEAFQTVDEWNQSNDIKVMALCWFTYSTLGITDESSDIYRDAIERVNNARLNQARTDFGEVIRMTDYVPGLPGSSLRFTAAHYTNSDLWGRTDGMEGIDYGSAGGEENRGGYRASKLAIEETNEGAVLLLQEGEWTRYETLAGGRAYTFAVRCLPNGKEECLIQLEKNGEVLAQLRIDGASPIGLYRCEESFELPPGHHRLILRLLKGSAYIQYFELQV